MFYFAFGSNLNTQFMKDRCPGSVVIGKAVLKNYHLGFTIFSRSRQCGCADIMKQEGSEVWGLLYRLTDKDLEALDKYENHPHSYERIEAEVMNEKNELVKVYTYQVVNKEPGLKPSKAFMAPMIAAAHELEFPREYREFLQKIDTVD
jgi:gamma-glutamylcyclotransferase (GGCT)/AIG2-like uncharacterized protein YtfP